MCNAENGDPIPSEADEELFHSLLAKAGMHLANAEGDESLVHLDADALQVLNECNSARLQLGLPKLVLQQVFHAADCSLRWLILLDFSCYLQAALRDKLLQDHSVLAAFLTGLRMYLEDPTKVRYISINFARALHEQGSVAMICFSIRARLAYVVAAKA